MKRRPRPVGTALLAASSLAVVSALVPISSAQSAPVRDGLGEDTAAASCWEIKQSNPSSVDGAYWLLTPTMEAPAEFYCDQTTDGGGWVLIGRGRESWDRYPQGQGAAGALLEKNRTPSAFPTVQLSVPTIDGLLGGGNVKDLEDGFRVVRARDAQGTQWQRFDVRPSKMTGWTWALGAEYPVTSYRIDNGAWRSGGRLSSSFGSDNGWNRMDTTMTSGRSYRIGFGYGSSAQGGSTSSSSFLWSNTGSAPLPQSEIYLRPKLVSTDPAFQRIPDSGTASRTQRAVVSSYASPTSWGLGGNLNGRTAEGNSQAQAFAQIGNVVFVGGNFTQVRRGAQASGSGVLAQGGLAAFDSTTGEPVTTFRPVFDNQVKALLAMPDGTLLAGGDFTRVNGEPHSGTVRLDAVTGQTIGSWDLKVENRISNGVVRVHSLALTQGHVYLGGAFTHLSGKGVNNVYARASGRVSLDGAPHRSWNPEFNGTVVDVDTS
ncbi:MAG: galactose oxidase, partial [Actinomyces sp.]|nr:galactose oxidase [Actinomyces sp.]